MKATIRQENQDNYNDVYETNTLAFGRENEAKLVNLLRNSNAFIPELSLVAITDNKLVGYILFSKVIITDENQNEFESLALGPMAVRPEFQKKGIGEQLIKTGFEKARELHYKSVIVLGHKEYYPKFGFEPAAKWHIKAPFNVPSDVFMALELVPDGLKGVSGMVKYPKEFSVV